MMIVVFFFFDIRESTVEARRVKRQITPQGNFVPSAAPQFNQIFVGDRIPRPPGNCPDAEDNRPCDPKSPFRTYSGWCNNLDKPQYGKDLTPFNRLLAPKYEDGDYHTFLVACCVFTI